jgi:hypothetical protein
LCRTDEHLVYVSPIRVNRASDQSETRIGSIIARCLVLRKGGCRTIYGNVSEKRPHRRWRVQVMCTPYLLDACGFFAHGRLISSFFLNDIVLLRPIAVGRSDVVLHVLFARPLSWRVPNLRSFSRRMCHFVVVESLSNGVAAFVAAIIASADVALFTAETFNDTGP